MISLPENWVYLVYKDGREENVANQDMLTFGDAKEFKERWEVKGEISSVILKDNAGYILKEYEFF